MSFDIPIDEILQAAVNTLHSFFPVITLFVGAAFAGFVLHILINVIRRQN